MCCHWLVPSEPTQAWYLLYFAATASIFPFLNVHFTTSGLLTQQQLGAVAAAVPWLSAPASLAWSALADRTQAHRWVRGY